MHNEPRPAGVVAGPAVRHVANDGLDLGDGAVMQFVEYRYVNDPFFLEPEGRGRLYHDFVAGRGTTYTTTT
jgi:hypothetical protein